MIKFTFDKTKHLFLMKSPLLLIIFVTIFSCGPKNTTVAPQSTPTADTTKSLSSISNASILFAGNSLTYSNDLPGILEMIASKFGDSLVTASISKPNFSLEDHWNEGDLQQLLYSGKFKYVIVQQGPSSQALGRAVLIEYGQKIKTVCDSTGASLGFFMVWPSKQFYHTFYDVMANYSYAAKVNNSLLFPVGVVWKAYDALNKKESLYRGDGFHPSRPGSFLAALTIFHKLYPDKDLRSMRLKDYESLITDQDSFDTMIELILKNVQ